MMALDFQSGKERPRRARDNAKVTQLGAATKAA